MPKKLMNKETTGDNIKYNEKLYVLIEDKINYIKNIIRNTNLSIQEYNKYELFSNTEMNNCITNLNSLYENIQTIKSELEKENTPNNSKTYEKKIENFIDKLQNIINNLSPILSKYGTKNIDDIIYICFGSEFNNYNIAKINPELPVEINYKFDLIKKYIHPIGFKLQNNEKKNSIQYSTNHYMNINKITDDSNNILNAPQFECFESDFISKSFHEKVYGIKIIIHSNSNKTLIINGIIDDINIDLIDNLFIDKRKKDLLLYVPEIASFNHDLFKRQINSLTLKDILIYSNCDIYKKNSSILMLANNMKISKLETTIKNFINMDLYSKRNTLIDLLLFNTDTEIQFIAYLLYDLITCKQQNNIDSIEQIALFQSFPWKIKTFFKDAMKNTINFTQNAMQKYDTNRVSIEQQIYLWHVPDNIKEKAISKLKEIKGKPDDSGIKAKQYLEGLLKIPFNSYKEEPILKISKKNNINFKQLIYDLLQNKLIKFEEIFIDVSFLSYEINSINFTNMEISIYLNKIKNILKTSLTNNILFNNLSKKNIINICKKYELKSKKNKIFSIQEYIKNSPIEIINEFTQTYNTSNDIVDIIKHYYKKIENIEKEILTIKTTINKIEKILDESIYGHNNAKKQIMKIICQWINGELSGYCFGFEGSPGIGKTSLAKKGLSNCLIDENKESRPFSFIALGGSCNGSTLEGHSYTYVNSTWGKIADILMESKCMNPIIYVDELDKVSKSEHGKEIIGILTHLIDSTQNDIFQDKYFNGIHLDLSKALFIFSYNDAEQIDRILLDRIHRIKFDNLTIFEKITIVNKYILPEFNIKMGFHNNIIKIDDDIIKHIINEYTSEPGVRKLKEILFDIYGEINIELLNSCNSIKLANIPIIINKDNLEKKYLKNYNKIKERKIHNSNKIGIVNGLWANNIGNGGIIPIEAVFFPSSTFFDLKLTGLQGDVMKESMHVSKTLAWKLTENLKKTKLLSIFKNTMMQGIHIHCPEGSISKDGPSAGVAITIAIYSLLNDLVINNKIAITGEINLQGDILAIGGLEHKILGGIQNGVEKFIIPKENDDEYEKFINKYLTNNDSNIKIKNFEKIKFYHVTNIVEVINIIFT